MKIMMVYQTADGKTFEDKEEAKRHELELDTINKLRSLLAASINSELVRRGNIDNVLRQMLLEHAEVRNILQSYNRKMPKIETAEVA
jgi:dsDNA-binding SOS-regulon protein